MPVLSSDEPLRIRQRPPASDWLGWAVAALAVLRGHCSQGFPRPPGTRQKGRSGRRGWGSGYSLIALYINSSSSRERLFVWTSVFSSMLARTCVAAKCVGRLAQSAGLTDNNFRVADFCVDNCPVVPELCPELSTAASHVAVRCSPWARRHNKKPGVL